MEQMPDEILCIMMDHMDDETLLNSILSSDRFLVAFSNSSRHLSRFTLKTSPENIKTFINNERILGIPFKNVSMSSISNANLKNFEELVKSLRDSIESLELSYCGCWAEKYRFLIGSFSQLKNLTLHQCTADMRFTIPMLPKMQNLKSVTFEDSDSKFFSMLENQPELEKLKVINHVCGGFDEFALSLPKLKHLVMEGVGTARYFETGNFPYRIEKLEAFSIIFDWQSQQSCLEFLKSQNGSLKELTIHRLPYGYYGNEILKYIIEEMQLESFHYGKIPLILNGQKQDVKEFQAFGANVSASFEMFRQFPTIETYNLFLTRTSTNDFCRINEMLSPRTDLLENVCHLNIHDNSGEYEYLYLFRVFYKNCRNIKKLTINSDCERLDEVLHEVLPELTRLNEIDLLTNLPNAVSRFQLIRNFGANVKKLGINANFANEAREFFRDDEIEIVGI